MFVRFSAIWVRFLHLGVVHKPSFQMSRHPLHLLAGENWHGTKATAKCVWTDKKRPHALLETPKLAPYKISRRTLEHMGSDGPVAAAMHTSLQSMTWMKQPLPETTTVLPNARPTTKPRLPSEDQEHCSPSPTNVHSQGMQEQHLAPMRSSPGAVANIRSYAVSRRDSEQVGGFGKLSTSDGVSNVHACSHSMLDRSVRTVARKVDRGTFRSASRKEYYHIQSLSNPQALVVTGTGTGDQRNRRVTFADQHGRPLDHVKMFQKNAGHCTIQALRSDLTMRITRLLAEPTTTRLADAPLSSYISTLIGSGPESQTRFASTAVEAIFDGYMNNYQREENQVKQDLRKQYGDFWRTSTEIFRDKERLKLKFELEVIERGLYVKCPMYPFEQLSSDSWIVKSILKCARRGMWW